MLEDVIPITAVVLMTVSIIAAHVDRRHIADCPGGAGGLPRPEARMAAQLTLVLFLLERAHADLRIPMRQMW